jgi:hypothetical protein
MITSRLASLAIAVPMVVLLGACTSLRPAEQNAVQLAALPAAGTCQADLPFFGYYRYTRDEREQYVDPDGRIAMANDGGWCAIRYQVMMLNGGFATGNAEVKAPPAHGEVLVGTLDGLLRIAYRPQPGFVGSDVFSVYLRGPIPYVIPVRVKVAS